MSQQINYNYEIIVVDSVGKSEITSVKSLSKALAYSEKLWHDSEIKEVGTDLIIEDTDLGITLQVHKIESLTKTNETTFILSVNSTNFEEIEKFRQKLLVHLVSKLGFVSAVILSDSVSEKIATNIYPIIKSVENAVRKNLTKLFLQNEGLNWWEKIASKNTIDKVNKRRNVAYSFEGFVDTSACLTDFDDINEMIHLASFANESFKSDWEKLTSIRDKVTTYSTLQINDYLEVKLVSKNILDILGEKNNVPHFKLEAETYLQTHKINTVTFIDPNNTKEPINSTKTVDNETEKKNEQEALLAEQAKIEALRKEESKKAEEAKIAEQLLIEANRAEDELKKANDILKAEEANKIKEAELLLIAQKEESEKLNKLAAEVKDKIKNEVNITEKSTPIANDVLESVEKPKIIQGDKLISENEFIDELKKVEKNSNGTFINLKYFVATVLSNGGYSTGYAYTLSKTLNEKGKVELYDAKDAVGIPVRAIKSK